MRLKPHGNTYELKWTTDVDDGTDSMRLFWKRTKDASQREFRSTISMNDNMTFRAVIFLEMNRIFLQDGFYSKKDARNAVDFEIERVINSDSDPDFIVDRDDRRKTQEILEARRARDGLAPDAMS